MDLLLISLLISTIIKTSQSLPLSNSNRYNYNKYDNFRDTREKSDLLAGKDFLDMFIENSQPSENFQYRQYNRRKYEKPEIRKYIVDPFEEEESSEGVLPIEFMFTSATTNSHSQYMLQHFRNRNSQYASSYQSRKDEVSDDEEEDQVENDSKEDLEQEFESERISKKQNKNPPKIEIDQNEDSVNSESSNSHVVTSFRAHPSTDAQTDQANFRNQRQQQHDLLFASHSATVTLNGPSGPFKAIICHDCDRKNENGQTVPHSVSFSAIKNWNVGGRSSKNPQNDENVQVEETVDSNSKNDDADDEISEISKDSKEPDPNEGFDEEIWAKKVDPQAKNFREPSKLFNQVQQVKVQETEDKSMFVTESAFASERPIMYNPEPMKPISHEPPKIYNPVPPVNYNIPQQQKPYEVEPQTNYNQKQPETYSSVPIKSINSEAQGSYNSNPPMNYNLEQPKLYNPPPANPLVFNSDSAFKSDPAQPAQNIPNPSNMNSESSFQTTSNNQQLTNTHNINPPHWRYLPTAINNDPSKIKSTVPQRKPIFTDLIKVPYDALNAPLDEYPQPKLPVQINHQQTFNHNVTSNYQHFQQFIQKTLTPTMPNMHNKPHYHSTPQPEQNYEVDEAVSVLTNGKAHGIQTTTPPIISSTTPLPPSPTTTPEGIDLIQQSQPNITNQQNPQDAKVGYVVEGRDYRKYRVEEKTPDGFIVGEYGVVSNNDGSPLQGVRYTASSDINPRLIYDALLKFLSL